MSEFSESFHLYTGDRRAVVTLLHAVGVGGVIAASNDRCVSFVIDDPEREDDLLAASRGVIARYYFGEDHGLWIRFYRDGRPLTRLALVWDDMGAGEEESDEQGIDPVPQAVAKLTGALVISDREAEELLGLLAEGAPAEMEASLRVAKAVPALLGFAAWVWLSGPSALSMGLEDFRSVYPTAEAVEADSP